MDIKTLDLKFSDSKSQFSEDDEFFHFSGYGAVFDNIDLGNDVIQKGAFAVSLKEMMPKLCYQHRMDEPLGVFTDAKEDDYGLFLKGKMPKENSQVKDVASLIKCGAIDSMSIGYRTIKSDYNSDTDLRHLKELKLFETSFVTFPMNPKAKVTDFKNLSFDEFNCLRDAEAMLKEGGMSAKEAKTFISKIKEFSSRDESDETPEHKDTARDAGGELDSEEFKNLHALTSSLACLLQVKTLTTKK